MIKLINYFKKTSVTLDQYPEYSIIYDDIKKLIRNNIIDYSGNDYL